MDDPYCTITLENPRERMVVAKALDDTTSIRSSNPVVPTVTRRDFIVLMA